MNAVVGAPPRAPGIMPVGVVPDGVVPDGTVSAGSVSVPGRMNRHELLTRLHEIVAPRTYLEIGVSKGESLTLSRVPSIGIDPDFAVHFEIHTDVHLARATSDDFFAGPDPLAHVGGRPIDLAFIDGMHLAEYALRDFINVETLCHPFSVIVLDDMLPRDVEEAARYCHTNAWAGDVFKVIEVLADRPDLVVLQVDTEPTGTVIVLLPDPANRELAAAYAEIEPRLMGDDPQQIPRSILRRSRAVDPFRLLEADFWATLVRERQLCSGARGAAVLRAEIAAADLKAMRTR